MTRRFIAFFILSLLCAASFNADACTSMLVSAKASATGRPLMWKHRDTGTEHNFVERVEAVSGKIGYVALFDGGDTKLSQAWMGMNDAGFAIMNTASYNLQPDTAKVKDLEGYMMTVALSSCRSVADFEALLKRLHKPLGCQANFGVMDAMGGLAYFEVNDHAFRRFDVSDSPDGYLIRTNFSMSGTKNEGYGYIRYANLLEILKPEIEAKAISPESLTEKASRSFYHSILKKDMAATGDTWVIDQDFIPRYLSSASIVVEGVNPGQPVNNMIMWTVLGYPPCSVVTPVTLNMIPNDLRPVADGFRSPLCNKVVEYKHQVFPINYGNGSHYINMAVLKQISEAMSKRSLQIYQRTRNPRSEAAPQQSDAAKKSADNPKKSKK